MAGELVLVVEDNAAQLKLLSAVSNPSLRDIIIVGVTAYAMPEDEVRVRAAGCDGYLTKPIDTHALPAVIASYLQPAAGP